MLSTELDTPLELLLLLEVTPLPPTAMPRPGGCATPGTLRLLVRSPTLSVCPSLGRCAPLSPSRSQGLPAPRSLSPLRPLSPTLLPLLSPPPLWLLSAMALALPLVLDLLVLPLLLLQVLAMLPVLLLWLLLAWDMP